MIPRERKKIDSVFSLNFQMFLHNFLRRFLESEESQVSVCLLKALDATSKQLQQQQQLQHHGGRWAFEREIRLVG